MLQRVTKRYGFVYGNSPPWKVVFRPFAQPVDFTSARGGWWKASDQLCARKRGGWWKASDQLCATKRFFAGTCSKRFLFAPAAQISFSGTQNLILICDFIWKSYDSGSCKKIYSLHLQTHAFFSLLHRVDKRWTTKAEAYLTRCWIEKSDFFWTVFHQSIMSNISLNTAFTVKRIKHLL